MNHISLNANCPRPRIGLLPTGHKIYWGQFPELKEKCLAMLGKYVLKMKKMGEVIMPELVDTAEKASAAGDLFAGEKIDLLIIFPLGYTTGMAMTPAIWKINVPIRILNSHLDMSYDYKTADTSEYLYHEGPCCIPEYSSALVAIGKKFKVVSGSFADSGMWKEIKDDCLGAASARAFRGMKFGVIGNTYTGMTDMPTDETRVLRSTGRLIVRPEIEEIEEEFKKTDDAGIKEMLRQFRQIYDVAPSVTDEHMRFSAQVAVAFEKVIMRHDISAFGYYWWGEKELITQLRSQSALAVSRLACLGRPGVTEGDVKTAMGMKILDLLGAGGFFVEFFCMDFKDNFLLLGHDGPSNVKLAEGRARLQHLDVHHGKTGSGIGIDFTMKEGVATLLNFSQFDAEDSFKLIYTVGEIVPGDILNIGNPNCRFKMAKPIPEFFDDWCQQGPVHHSAIGLGDVSRALESYAEAMKFKIVRV